MLIKAIDFPPEVLQAQKDGNLVVFAGAGVSMPAPSGLPSFNKLAKLIGEGANARQDDETEDRYLGRLHDDGKGIQVHEIAAKILLDSKSQATALHKSLLRIFGSNNPVRLITTNFDNHFSSAAASLGLDNTEVFVGPALPLGDNFTGIVYLHGSASKSPATMVMTDGDFGRAYLTYGWASRFLYQLFSTYTVLFVGYSHNDVVMRYLARGLPPESQNRRFAFAERGKDSTWKIYGIKPLQYELRDHENKHVAITESVQEWSEEISRGLFAKSERIRSIVEAAPPLAGEDADYLKYSLSVADTTHQFTKFTRNPTYIDWLDQQKLLANLFNPKAEITDVDRELLHWLLFTMLSDYPQYILALIQRNGQWLHPDFCWRLQHKLTFHRDEEAIFQLYPVWIPLLLTQPFADLSIEDWVRLLGKCRRPEHRACAIMLFEFITKPKLVLERSWPDSPSQENTQPNRLVGFGINIASTVETGLHECWNEIFNANLEELIDIIEPIVTTNLRHVHALLKLTGTAHDDYDHLSVFRQQVEHPAIYPKVFDALVGAARDIIRFITKNDKAEATRLIQSWFSSEVPILKRLAIYGFAIRPYASANTKILWVLKHDLLFRSAVKPEVFGLLRQCFPVASEQVRRKIVQRIKKGRTEEVDADEHSKYYERYNILVWLEKSDPACEIVKQEIKLIHAKYPSFRPRERPDLNYWMSSSSEVEESSLNLDEILEKPPSDFLDRLPALRTGEPTDFFRNDPVYAIMKLIAKEPSWGFALQAEILERQIVDTDIWTQIFNGWREAKLDSTKWIEWFDTIDRITNLSFAQASGITDVLYTHGQRKEWAIPENLMDRAYVLSQRVWETVEKHTEVESTTIGDWLILAINRPSGQLGRFWLEYVSVLRTRSGTHWEGLPMQVVLFLRHIVHNSSYAAELARVVIASQLHYFFSLEANFARKELIPLFDWDKNIQTAKQAWDGFLMWGRWLTAYLDEMLPFYLQTLTHLKSFSDQHQRSYVAHIASICCFGKADPVHEGWLSSIIASFDEEARTEFARVLGSTLESLTPDIAEEVWDRWLQHYWEDRLVRKPVELSGNEVHFMTKWPLYLSKVFPSAVDMLSRSPMAELRYSLIDEELNKLHSLANVQGESVADYLLIVLRSTKGLYGGEQVKALIAKLQTVGVQAEKLSKLNDQMLRLGW